MRSRPGWVPDVAVIGLAVSVLGVWGLWRTGDEPRLVEEPALASAPAVPVTAIALRDEALRLYAAGHFPQACDRFTEAADQGPGSRAGREDVARCFEAWGWQALRAGRPDEARALFVRGLHASPEDPGLLKGLGIATIHAGHPQEALDPLEKAAGGDAEIGMLLARLYDQRDEPEHAVRHLKALLAREPRHRPALSFLEKVERERHVEADFRRHTTQHFVVKYRGTREREVRGAVVRALEAARDRVGSQLGWWPLDRVTVVVYDDSQFRAVARVHGWVTGLYDGKIRLPMGTVLPAAAKLDRLVTHEYAHAAVHDLSRGRAPRWLHEGLAQALEGAGPDPLLRVPGRLTLSGLEALVTDPDPVRARAGYDIALWVTQDLMNRGGLPALRALLEQLGAGETVGTALARVYGVRLTELESQWRSFLGG